MYENRYLFYSHRISKLSYWIKVFFCLTNLLPLGLRQIQLSHSCQVLLLFLLLRCIEAWSSRNKWASFVSLFASMPFYSHWKKDLSSWSWKKIFTSSYSRWNQEKICNLIFTKKCRYTHRIWKFCHIFQKL